jgi:hypothetical protein
VNRPITTLCAPSNGGPASGLLVTLRALMPRRATPLTVDEALQIAERQAGVFRRELGYQQAPALPASLVGALPFVRVAHEPLLPTPGLLLPTTRGWVIALNAADIATRKKFSALHELKHLLDDPFVTSTRHDPRAERVCNHFAACALMPRVLLKRDWGNRIQDPVALARRYGVSLDAMTIRLQNIGLVDIARRGHRADMSADEVRCLATRLAHAWQPGPTASVA